MKNLVLFFVALAFGLVLLPKEANAQAVSRPPQFVLLSYDGSYSLDAWKAIRAESLKQKQKGTDTRYTFFASGVYFLQSAKKTYYQAPGKNPGRSDIGFGGTTDEISLRIDEMNQAYAEGHEIGSHANGHFDGSKWSTADWMSEFNQFEDLIFNVFSLNKISPARTNANGWLFSKSSLKGFRAPLLGSSEGLWTTLKNKNFTYDCSKIGPADYWPEKSASGIWNFPLASLNIAGTNKRTLSMDYNFYVAQSGGKSLVENKELYAKQMYDTYTLWFQKNYNGNRAPLNIGHHFSSWNGGAYFSAMNRFAARVCGLPEVKCVTYTEYVQWLENQPAAKLASYKKGQFPRATPVQIANVVEATPGDVSVALKSDAEGREVLVAKASGIESTRGLTARLSVNGKLLNRSMVHLEQVRNVVPSAETAVTAHLYNDQGLEIARKTQTVRGLHSDQPAVGKEVLEAKALKGDLPEAHLDERSEFIIPNF